MPQLKRDSIVYLDTNVFLEAKRSNNLNAVTNGFPNLATVEKVIEELNTGNKQSADRVSVDTSNLAVNVESVEELDRATLMLKLNGEIELDAGELDLLAKIVTLKTNAFFVCSPDKACVKAARKLGFGDNVISLEELLQKTGHQNPNIRDHFKKKWLDDLKTKFLLEEY